MRGTGGRGSWRVVAAALAVVVAVGGCVGATPRDEFDAEVVERGGGLVPALALDAIAALEAELGTDDAAFEHITITPLARVVSMTVQDPGRPQNLDDYVVREGDLSDPRPVQLSDVEGLEASLFSADDVPALGRLDEVGAAAVRELGIPDGVVTSVVVSRAGGDLRMLLSVESERARGTAVFTPEGELVEAVRS
jgi:hypothetical protein